MTEITLIHVPLGAEHPYESEQWERSPRNPVEGEPVMLGVLTRGVKPLEVWAEWRADHDEHLAYAAGSLASETGDERLWTIPLPAFEMSQRIEYQVLARSSSCVVHSEKFSFVVSGWLELQRLLNIWVDGDSLEILCELTDESKVQISLSVDSQGNLVTRHRRDAERSHHQRNRDTHKGMMNSDSQPPHWVLISREDSHTTASIQGFRIEVDHALLRLSIMTPEGRLLLKEARPAAWLVDARGRASKFRSTFRCTEQEDFFGFGERFNTLGQRGNLLDIRTYAQFAEQGLKTYIPVPFFISKNGYGHYVDSTRRTVYDLAHSNPEVWSFEAETGSDGVLDQHLFAGTPIEVIHSFAGLVGKPELPPAWAFGPWMSGNEWNSEKRVMQEVHKSLELGIPVSVLVIEAWSDESTFYIWNDSQYEAKIGDEAFSYSNFLFPEEGHWPNPKRMIDELHRLGIRVLLWQIPVLKWLGEPHLQRDLDEEFMIRRGYCVQEANGTPYRVRDEWFHNSLVLDVTKPDAVSWWLRKRAYLLDELGVDGFKTDGGEHVWGMGQLYSNGSKNDEIWNVYPNLYVDAYHRFANDKHGNDAITFSRAGYTGAQRFPCHWAGDEKSTWGAYRASLLAGLSVGISGIPFWGWDIAGFTGKVPSAELYLRATAMATFCPIMQYHSDFNHHREPCRDRTPWNIAERTDAPQVVAIYRSFAQLRMQLLPYIKAEAAHSAATGEPLMRALFLDWPEDPVAWKIADQYCFGRTLLVAPVVEPGVYQRRLYLPDGEWEDFWDGTHLTGGRWITRLAPLDIIPVYRRIDAP